MTAIDPKWAWDHYKPTTSDPWTIRQATHLYRRAGFGGNHEQIQQAIGGGMDESLQQLLFDNHESPAFRAEMAGMTRSLVANGNLQSLATGWLYRMLKTSNQLHEKTTLLWHGHFATSADKVQDAFMMQQQNDLLREHAVGDFNKMVQGISQNPAMLLYLDSANNRKTHPNENYARELMELFCLGEGQYSEQDIRELARCFTGWEVRNRAYRFNRYQHDFGEKAFLGTQGNLTGEEAVEHVLKQPAAPLFIARKLVHYFVIDEPAVDEALLVPLAKQLRKDDFNLMNTIRIILSSNIFYSSHAIARKIKSPVEMMIGVMRVLSMTSNLGDLANGLQQLGHGVFFPPNVKGWDGGRTWINSSTLLGRSNLIYELLHHEKTSFDGGSLQSLLAKHEKDSLVAAADYFVDRLCAIPLAADTKNQIIRYARTEGSDREQQLKSILHQIAAIPHFQIG